MEISKRVEKYIQEHTRVGSNTTNVWRRKGVFIPSYSLPWLTPDDARKAVEMAREEIYEWLKDNIYMYNGECEGDRKAIIEDLKQVMKDE